MLRYLKALVVLQAAILDEREDAPKSEVLLHRAGMAMPEIADLLGKSYGAVAQTISRERRARRKRGAKTESS